MQADPARIPRPEDGLFGMLEPAVKLRLDAVRRVQTHPAGHIFCVEGDPPHCVNLILEGSVKLTRSGERGDPQVIRLLGAGSIFGLRPVLAGDTLAASAVALEPCRAARYPASAVLETLEHSPAFARAALAYMARELRYSEDMLMVLTRRPVKRRIADVLLLLHGRRVPGDSWSPFPRLQLKRKDIAQMVGTTPETLSRTLAEFASKGLISVDRRRIELRDAAGLERVERDELRTGRRQDRDGPDNLPDFVNISE